MFRKLIKHEWRSTAGTQGILAAAALGVSILAGIVLRLLTTYSENLSPIANAGIVISLVFMGLAFVGCTVAMGILLLVRFYKNKFTDEGYLTFTLPANSHQIFLSAFVNMALWSIISGFVILLGTLLFVIIGLYDPKFLPDAEQLQGLKWVFQQMDLDGEYIGAMILQILIATPYTLVMAMTSITLGAVIAKKHKILAAFGIYYGISYLSGIVSSIVTVVLSLQDWEDSLTGNLTSYSTQSLVITVVWEVIMIAAGYILSTQLMTKKLNLR